MTFWPSVVGEGEAKLLFSSRRMPSPTFSDQRTLPLLRSRAMARSVLEALSIEDTKTWLPQMMGELAAGPGMGALPATFSVFDHLAGRFFSVVEPLKKGPRHCGQFSARAAEQLRRAARMNASFAN